MSNPLSIQAWVTHQEYQSSLSVRWRQMARGVPRNLDRRAYVLGTNARDLTIAKVRLPENAFREMSASVFRTNGTMAMRRIMSDSVEESTGQPIPEEPYPSAWRLL